MLLLQGQIKNDRGRTKMTGYLESTGDELLQHCLVLYSHFPKIFHTESTLDLYAQRSIRLKRERREKSGTKEKKKRKCLMNSTLCSQFPLAGIQDGCGDS